MKTGSWLGNIPIGVLVCKDKEMCKKMPETLKADAIAAAKRRERIWGNNYNNRLNRPQDPYVKLTDSDNAILFMDISTNQSFPDQFCKNLNNIAKALQYII